MAISFVDDCNGCETCINCGKNKKYKILICDVCEEELNIAYKVNDLILCRNCAWEEIEDCFKDNILKEYEVDVNEC